MKTTKYAYISKQRCRNTNDGIMILTDGISFVMTDLPLSLTKDELIEYLYENHSLQPYSFRDKPNDNVNFFWRRTIEFSNTNVFQNTLTIKYNKGD